MLKDYIADKLTNHPLLTAKEEFALGVASNAGNIQARNKLVTHNMRYAIKLASRFHHHLLPFDEAVSVATIGLVKAAASFNPEKYGRRFTTLAHHCMMNMLRNEFTNLTRLSKTIQVGGFDLDGNYEESGESASLQTNKVSRVTKALDRLDANDRYLLKAHYGIAPNIKPVPLRELGRIEGVSHGTIWNMLNRAKDRLRAVLQEITDTD